MYDDRKQLTEKQRDRRTMALLGLELVGLIVAAVSIGLIAGSCGEQQANVASDRATSAAADPSATLATVASQTPSPPQHGVEVTSADSLPPEVAASVVDTLVVPGAAVEIAAETSIDATELTLWDGIGKRQPFVYDEQGKQWRAFYRVPLKSAERVGLSVTAKNDAHRWRRVWVFLRLQREGGSTVVEPTQP